MATPVLLPVRMLNEHVYCPRLFALEWLHGEWAESADTLEGSQVHRRVDKERGELPAEQEGDPEPTVTTSLYLGDPELRLVARIDLVEAEDGLVVPVDYKKSKVPRVASGAWEPERVQVCAQALLLRAHGHRVVEGVLYYAGSRRRVAVPLTEELIAATLEHRDRALALVDQTELPPPLIESPKCPRCSLLGICLPDETNLLLGRTDAVRPVQAARDDGVPLYVQLQGGRLGKDHDEIVVSERRSEVGRARFEETTRVAIYGNVTVTTPLLAALAERDIAVAWHSYGGWFRGLFTPASGHGVFTRMAQHRAASSAGEALVLARAFIHAKISNSRVLLRRNGVSVPAGSLEGLARGARDALRAPSLETLLGIEGAAARLYFQQFSRMLKGGLAQQFGFEGRNRRPPRDPINAMLSLAYSGLVRELTAILVGVGLDPYVGFLHKPRHGRPALALDLMEEFRPTLADSVVITAVNNGVVREGDFITRSTGCAMKHPARRRFFQVFERRLDQLVTHPVLGSRLSYRRILEVQARLLGRVLTGELEGYPELLVR